MLETCQAKIDWITSFFLKIAELLPQSPLYFRIQYLTEMINQESSWGLGGVILELLSGIIQYVQLIVAWKLVKMFVNVLGSKL